MRNRQETGYKRNLAIARRLWTGQIGRQQQNSLRFLLGKYGLSIAAGDLQLLDSRWYVTHSGLLRLAERRHCCGIGVTLVSEFCDQTMSRWVFKAVVYKADGTKGFVGYGDADPSNISSIVQGAELRVAETRAVNRALRKAYGIGLCSVEELGAFEPSTTFPDSFVIKWLVSVKRLRVRPTSASGSTLPSYPRIQPQFESRKSVRR